MFVYDTVKVTPLKDNIETSLTLQLVSDETKNSTKTYLVFSFHIVKSTVKYKFHMQVNLWNIIQICLNTALE